MRSIVCNPQLVAVCNHFEEMYVINPKEETYKAYALMTYRLQSKRITYAYRRLHANPSDWIKIRQSKDCLIFWRRHPDSNRGVRVLQTLALPLGHGTKLFGKISQTGIINIIYHKLILVSTILNKNF